MKLSGVFPKSEEKRLCRRHKFAPSFGNRSLVRDEILCRSPVGAWPGTQSEAAFWLDNPDIAPEIALQKTGFHPKMI